MQRNFIFSSNEYYHIYNRGADKRVIFNEDRDYLRFLVLLYICNSDNKVQIRSGFKDKMQLYFEHDRGDQQLVDICCYCLMPNHFHLLLKERVEGGIPIFMKKLLTAYSMYFNKKYERTGKLFENCYKAEHANTDNYLKYLFSYIHLNPVKLIDPAWKENGVKDFNDSYNFLQKYEYSSYQDYLNVDRVQKVIINIKALPEYFVDKSAVENDIFDWLDFRNDQI